MKKENEDTREASRRDKELSGCNLIRFPCFSAQMAWEIKQQTIFIKPAKEIKEILL